MPVYDFSDEQIDRIGAMLDWFDQHKAEGPGIFDDTDLTPAPGVHVARLIATLPALSQNAVTGTGTGDADNDTPGSLTCDLYRITSAGALESLGISRTIYNLSPTAIEVDATAKDGWIPVVRTAAGRWVAFYCCG